MLQDPRMSVLVVEDHPDGAETLATLIDLCGYSVRIAFTGEDALQLAHESPPDCALIDIGLPGMNGVELARRLRALLGRKPLLIAVSGLPSREKEALAAGIELFFLKPVNPDQLATLLRSHAATIGKGKTP